MFLGNTFFFYYDLLFFCLRWSWVVPQFLLHEDVYYLAILILSISETSLTHFLLCVRPQWSGVCRPILRECRRAPNCNRAGVLLGNGSHQAIVILSPISPYSYQNLTHTFFFPHTHTEKAKYHCNLPISSFKHSSNLIWLWMKRTSLFWIFLTIIRPGFWGNGTFGATASILKNRDLLLSQISKS